MQIFIKIILIIFVLGSIKSDFKLCGNKNGQCNINEILISNPETNNVESLIKHAIQHFHNLNHKQEEKIDAITNDIGYIKKSLQSFHCSSSLQTTFHEEDSKEETETSNGLYDNLWIMIQRRQSSSTNFFRKWDNYKHGFGNPFRDFFIGLDKIHELTNSTPHELLIKLEDFKGNIKYALYDEFLVGDESENYQLKKLGNYSGNAGDYMRNHTGMYFSTKDRDNDASANLHCALRFQGGWWYNNCLTSNLNGPFRTRYVISNVGITWGKFDEMQHTRIISVVHNSVVAGVRVSGQ
ncbi:ryncolin-4-like isoform 2-T2 [Cochliomyia hominivorax]